jgi:hypothetical protein
MANSYLFRNFTSAGNRKTFTFSAWVKFSDASSISTLFATGADSENRLIFIRHDSGSGSALKVDGKTSTNQTIEVRTNRAFRDTNAFYHIVLRVDTTQSTASDRVRIYVNGVQETSFAQSTYPSQNYDTEVNKTANHMVGRYSYSASNYMNGYMSHVAFVDGASLAPTSFGQTDSTSGIWKFKSPSGITWGTNGFHLKFENSGNLGLDSSSNTANWTSQGNLKQSLSTPSNVYNTWNFNNKYNNMTIQNAGTAIAWQQTSGNAWCASNLGVDSGKWYWEWKAESEHPEANTWGAMSVDSTGFTDPKTDSGVWCMNQGVKHNGSNGGSYGSQIDIGNIGMVAVDMDNGKIWLGENGTWFASGDPAAGSNAMYTNLSGKTVTPFHADTYSTYTPYSSYNFGEGRFGTTAISSAGSNGNGSLFEYDVPSGFYALNTKNINTYG